VRLRASESDSGIRARLSLDPIRIQTKRRVSMSNAGNHHKITYIEFPSTDIEQTKKFYSVVFGWTFQDWGPDYVSFHGAGIDGGFVKRGPGDARMGGPGDFAPLVVLYSSDLEATEIAVRMEGGGVVVPTFAFPGGRRFHFSDGVGNVLGVWSE
jgi:hypothetical protein